MLSRLAESISELRDRRTRARRRVEEVFSRDVLGSILVSLSLSKVVETSLTIIAPRPIGRLAGWVVLSMTFIALFVYWERAASAAKNAAESAAESAAED